MRWNNLKLRYCRKSKLQGHCGKECSEVIFPVENELQGLISLERKVTELGKYFHEAPHGTNSGRQAGCFYTQQINVAQSKEVSFPEFWGLPFDFSKEDSGKCSVGSTKRKHLPASTSPFPLGTLAAEVWQSSARKWLHTSSKNWPTN